MKKNRTMRVGAIVLALVLITCCIVSSTLAKYVAGADASDSARVALFSYGTNLAEQVELADTFLGQYYDEELYASGTDNYGFNGDQIIAPGTCGYFTFDIYGIAEVDTEMIFTIQENQPNLGVNAAIPLLYFLDGQWYSEYYAPGTYYFTLGEEAEQLAIDEALIYGTDEADGTEGLNIYEVEVIGDLADFAYEISRYDENNAAYRVTPTDEIGEGAYQGENNVIEAGEYLYDTIEVAWFWAFERYDNVEDWAAIPATSTDLRDGVVRAYNEILDKWLIVENAAVGDDSDTGLGLGSFNQEIDLAAGVPAADLADYVNEIDAPWIEWYIAVEWIQVD